MLTSNQDRLLRQMVVLSFNNESNFYEMAKQQSYLLGLRWAPCGLYFVR